jgi:hypothetical protein
VGRRAHGVQPERHDGTRQRDDPTGGTVTVTVVVQATAANGYTNTVTLTPLSNVTNLGSTTATAPGTATCSHAEPDQGGGQQHDRGGRYDQLHDRDRQHGPEHADDGEHRGHTAGRT